MATLAIGDIHGNVNALDDLLTQIERELTPADTVWFLGDYIDRGPSSKACVERLLDFRVDDIHNRSNRLPRVAPSRPLVRSSAVTGERVPSRLELLRTSGPRG